MKCLNNLTDQQLIHSMLMVMLMPCNYCSPLQRKNLHFYLPAGKDRYLAEDIFQDVFIRIIDTLKGGRYTG